MTITAPSASAITPTPQTSTTPQQNALTPSLPDTLTNAIKQALEELPTHLTWSSSTSTTHEVLQVVGWGKNTKAIDAVATYFVGLLVSSITRALQIRAQVQDTLEDKLEILKSVESLAGSPSVPLSPKQKTDERNPWMAECLWHLCLNLSSKLPALHPHGQVVALDFPHIAAKDHGFDVIALYLKGNTLGISIVESKAYENNPNGAISDAVEFYRSVDQGTHDVRLRQTVSAFRESIPANLQGILSASLWKNIRTYLPNPHYNNTAAVDWTNQRHSFKTLKVGKSQILIMPHETSGFSTFFDAIGASMWQFAQSL
ncbi:hypothetical protein HUA76_27575 [Myxococcus sp. CA056]|uniref:hypothetical protein n=1 Tax=Myxococcus sp. CA056 TaxID=2741740 RepID=UPI00157BAE6F|nr:hypothetical protein [Myxococcus sp. CA056]NTX14568.1 hypothetical protein [Myxococcus sp. CA056]